MIGQQIALKHLVPLALDVLETNPLVEGDYYPGDLMSNVLTVDPAYWEEHQADWLRMHSIVDDLLAAVEELARPIEKFKGLTQGLSR